MTAATFGMLGSLATSLYNMQGKQGGAAFEAMKAFRIGETIMNTYSAAVGAYNALASIPYVGPFLGRRLPRRRLRSAWRRSPPFHP